ncbi:MAG: hypothetical protein KGJ62_04005 [Armatimonadetes bacterium]|nr:hypothetical protein [Armatimonadota bacterium]MDE2205646.1 hypothetical protein [Armatimonadota bacterium]
MKRETPVLMISLQIPVEDETTPNDVLEAIASEVRAAFDRLRREQQARADGNDIAEMRVTAETQEPLSEATQHNLLKEMGYPDD